MLNGIVRNSRQTNAALRCAADYYFCKGPYTSEIHLRSARRLFNMFVGNGGIYIKTGQHMGQMDNLVPKEYVEVFEPMLNHMPTQSFEGVRAIIEEEMGQKLEDLFSEFDEKPLASASIA